MEGNLGIGQKTNKGPTGTWSREVLVCPKKILAKQKLIAAFMDLLLIWSVSICKHLLVSSGLMFASEIKVHGSLLSQLIWEYSAEKPEDLFCSFRKN